MELVKVNFIALEVYNLYLESVHKLLKSEFLDYIDIKMCGEQGLVTGVETEPHITLIYSKNLENGPNWYYWFTTIKNRELWKQVKEIGQISVKNVIIDTFDNDDSRVLKINLSNSNIVDLLTDLHSELESTDPIQGKYSKYNPHITLTYLKKDTPDEVIDKLKSKLILSNLLQFELTNLIIGTQEKNFKFQLR